MFTTELQYVVVRYMLNELGDEAANVGLVAVTNDPPRVLARFLPDPSVKSRNDARVKSDAVKRFAVFAERQIALPGAGQNSDRPLPESAFTRLKDFGGNVVRVSLPRSVLTNNVETEFDLLFGQLVAPSSAAGHQHEQRPRDPLGGLRKEAANALVGAFREGYGHPLRRKSFARSYGVQGASHRNVFDLAVLKGTKKKPREHLFHHLLVLPEAEESFTQAAALCWRWSDIRSANHAERQLTAVPYERGNSHPRMIADAARILKDQDIEVARIDQLPSLVRKLNDQGALF